MFVGYNTIESYSDKKLFEGNSGANYEWSLICIKHPENSKLLYGEDIRDQIPGTDNIRFDFDNILIRGVYHLEKSFKNSKTLFKFGFYFCVLHDKSFQLVSLAEIRKGLEQLYKSGKIDRQIFEYYETAFEYRNKGYYDSDFKSLRIKTRYYFISLLKKGKTHNYCIFHLTDFAFISKLKLFHEIFLYCLKSACQSLRRNHVIILLNFINNHLKIIS